VNDNQNEDRIRRWRERRRLGISSTDHRAAARTIAAANAERAIRSGAVTVEAMLVLVLEALAAFPDNSTSDRRAVYVALQEGWDRGIHIQKLEQLAAEFQRRRLRSVIRFIEEDIRAGAGVFDPAYDAARIKAADAKLANAYRDQTRRAHTEALRKVRRDASRGDMPLDIALPPDEAADLAQLRPMIAEIHGRQAVRAANRPTLLSTLLPIFMLQLRVIQSDSRVALLWSLMGPVVLMTLISTLYLISGIRYVLNMDVATFAMTGATTWIMLRIIVFRSSGSFFGGRPFFNIELVRPLGMVLSLSTVYFLNYLFVFFALISLGHLAGLIQLPADPIGFVFYVASIGVGAASLGLIFGSIAVRWRYFLRFAPVIERAMELFSGVFFVSEQLPAPYKKFILWMPFCHGIQLERSAYFAGYKSQDASPAYFFTSMAVLFLIGLAAERMVRPYVDPM
jgi:capsular polysaccharide transport system permease protein